MKQSDHIIARQIHDSFFLIDIKQDYSNDKCSLYEINEIGYFIWNELKHSGTISDIAKALFDWIADDINYEELLSDIEEYLDVLIEERFVEA